MTKEFDLIQNRQRIEEIITELQPFSTDGEKKLIDSRLSHFPYLKKLVGNNPDVYKKFCEFRYKNELIDDSVKYPSFRKNDYKRIKKIVYGAREYALGGLLLDTGEYKLQLLQNIETILKANGELYEYGYQTKICNEPFEVHSEFLVYSTLKRLGYLPEHEPQLYNTTVTPDFKIIDGNGKPCFIEVKTRHYSFEEVKQFIGLSRYLPQIGFVDIDADTRKTDDVFITACTNQITKLNQVYPEIPVILVIESLLNIDGMQLNLLEEGFEKRCVERQFSFPGNLKMGVVFTAPPESYIKITYCQNFQHELIQKVTRFEDAVSKARMDYFKNYGTKPFSLEYLP